MHDALYKRTNIQVNLLAVFRVTVVDGARVVLIGIFHRLLHTGVVLGVRFRVLAGRYPGPQGRLGDL